MLRVKVKKMNKQQPSYATIKALMEQEWRIEQAIRQENARENEREHQAQLHWVKARSQRLHSRKLHARADSYLWREVG